MLCHECDRETDDNWGATDSTVLCEECCLSIEEKAKTTQLEEVKPQLLVECASCRKMYSARAKACPKCGSVPTRECCICKADIPTDSVDCPECGDPEPFTVVAEVGHQQHESSSQHTQPGALDKEFTDTDEWKIYSHSNGNIHAIEVRKWSYATFFFAPFWLTAKLLWSQLGIYIFTWCAAFLIAAVAYETHGYTYETKPTIIFEWVIFWNFTFLLNGWVAVKGDRWHEFQLRKKAYQFKQIINAISRETAVEKFRKKN